MQLDVRSPSGGFSLADRCPLTFREGSVPRLSFYGTVNLGSFAD